MRLADWLFLAGLAAMGAWIWLRDTGLDLSSGDMWPLLASLPLMAWLGDPWELTCFPRTGPGTMNRVGASAHHQPSTHRPSAGSQEAAEGRFRLDVKSVGTAGVALVAGLLSGVVGLLALGWTALLWGWLSPRLSADGQARAWRLMPLALLAFPWIALDLPSLGWWYRLSAAWSVEHGLDLVGLAVRREGTQLFVHQLPFDVAPACSGIQTLQALLVAGTALCFLQIGRCRFYWLALGLLPLVAWLANATRVLLVIAGALSFGPAAIEGGLHTTGGWFVLMVMFGLTWLALEMLRRIRRRPLAS